MRVDDLTKRHRAEAAQVLIESFRDYPYMRYVLETTGAGYEAALDALVRFILDARWARRHPVMGVREGEALVAVATVVDAGPSEPSAEVERLFARLRQDLGEAPCERMSAYENVAVEGRPEAPFHYLGMLGVAPGAQGGGYGTRLVEATRDLARSHASSTGVCLNTETEENVGLYEHLGFRVVSEGDVGPMHTWCMFWEAKPDR